MNEELDLDALQRLADAATPGPWQLGSQTHGPNAIVRDAEGLRTIQSIWVCDADVGAPENAEFIAAARSAVPALLDRVRELEAEKARIAPLFENLSREYPVECNKRVKADAERDAALSTIAKVREIHASFTDPDGTFCKVCEWVEYPCPTIRALGSVPSTGEGNE